MSRDSSLVDDRMFCYRGRRRETEGRVNYWRHDKQNVTRTRACERRRACVFASTQFINHIRLPRGSSHLAQFSCCSVGRASVCMCARTADLQPVLGEVFPPTLLQLAFIVNLRMQFKYSKQQNQSENYIHFKLTETTLWLAPVGIVNK